MSHDQIIEICASMLVGAIIGGATVMVCFIKTGRCNHYGKDKTLDNHDAGMLCNH